VNIYVETNFVLELVYEQEQCASCEKILELCEAQKANLIIPAYSLAEPHEKLIRQAKERRALQQSLDKELRELSRTKSYKNRLKSIEDIKTLIVQSSQEIGENFAKYREYLLKIAEIIPLNADILLQAASAEENHKLSPQDALVYVSVLKHLQENKPQQACFLNCNSKDFKIPEIDDQLESLNCRLITQFDDGYKFLDSMTQQTVVMPARSQLIE
jgi:predicted nucleic acid-binding protein